MFPKTHAGTLRGLGLHFVSPGFFPEELARVFSVALETRQRADYGSLTAFTEEQARAVLEGARRFVDHVAKLLSEGGR